MIVSPPAQQETPRSASELAARSLSPRAVLNAQWREQMDQLTALSMRMLEITDERGSDADRSGQVVQDLIDAAREQMRSTEAALDRITQHTYGRCESCGQAIDPLRLAALPTASNCRRCDRQAHGPATRSF